MRATKIKDKEKGKEKTVPRFKVSSFGGRGPARAARPKTRSVNIC